MILDKLLEFDPALTALTVTAVSTNVLDMLVAREMGIGMGEEQRPQVQITVNAALVSAGATTLQVQLQASVDNAAWTIEAQTDAIPKANLGVGAVIRVPLGIMQPQSAGVPRYYRLNYVVATGPFTGGSIQAELVIGDGQTNNALVSYPPGIVITN
jgi:hypothetical protein